MFLHDLEVSGFRNLKPQRIAFKQRVTVISGQNGQGKTSLLEAIYLLSHNKSFRASKFKDLIRWSSDEPILEGNSLPALAERALVRGDFLSSAGEKSIRFEIATGTRKVFVNEKRVEKPSHFFGQLTSVVFTPDELELVRGGPLARRNFLDRTIAMVDSSFIDHSVQYQRVLKNRNALLLKSGKGESGSRSELAVWSALLVEHGLHIVRRRRAFLDILKLKSNDYYHQICELLPERNPETVAIQYESDFLEGKDTSEFANEADLLAEYEQRVERDQRQGSTSFGPHRDDCPLWIDTGFGPKLARASASQGQARTLALALKLAAIDYISDVTGEVPILLLDDVESELDKHRRNALFKLLERFQSQVLVTTTEVSDEVRNMSQNIGYVEIFDGLAEPAREPKIRA